jgi:D-alanyl-D-alanine carboxypeptidase/D-alanyl-D-alanine-endopeptidase (penicillin-binding protein 4)
VGVRRPDAPNPYRARRHRKRFRWLRLILWVAAIAVIAIVVTAISRTVAAHRAPTSLPSTALRSTGPVSQGDANSAVRHGVAWTSKARRTLHTLATDTFGDPAFPPQTGVVIESARDGSVLYSRNASMSLTPASVQKLVIAATALHYLGPSYRFTTRIVTDAAPQSGAITGSVWLIGSGDPELTSHDLRVAVNAIRDQGIVRIAGDVVADGSLFGSDNIDATWEADDLEYGYAAPTSAVTLDGGTAQFTITPDPAGGVADVRVDPPNLVGPILGDVRTVSADGENTLRIDPVPGTDSFQVSGDIPYGAPQKYWRSIAHPEASAANALRTMFQTDGFDVTGGASVGASPKNATVLWSKHSRPLSAIIRRMLFDSDNHIAEQLVRAVGAHDAGIGTLSNGIAREHAFLALIGAPQDGVALKDASGLSASDRITPRALAAVLGHLAADSAGPAIGDMFPRVGVEGTVHVRDLAPEARGRVLGKDGYIGGVSSLAGYVLTKHHGVVIYVFIVNNWDNSLDSIWRAEDDVLSKVAAL